MKHLALLTCIGLLGACTMDDRPSDRAANDEQKLATILAGYEQAGPPVSCVNNRDLGGNRSVGETAIVFDGPTNSTLWVNRPPAGCPSLDFGRALVTHTTTSQLCRGDIATVYDPVARMSFGSCGLGDFTPYRRVRR
ncbi:MAG: hypothetical protein QOH81_2062 [Sphingomonadales bacterium]|jgi:hypothetical protein|nr:hypothetical protein [Sphingomonadales bacterium]